MSDISVMEITVAIAVSECGLSMVSLINNNNVQARQKHQDWLAALKIDSRLWTVKTIKTWVPMPVQYEEIDQQ